MTHPFYAQLVRCVAGGALFLLCLGVMGGAWQRGVCLAAPLPQTTHEGEPDMLVSANLHNLYDINRYCILAYSI